MAADVLSERTEWATEAAEFDFVQKPTKNSNGYTYLLEDKLTSGTSIIIEGTIQEKCTSFTVNLRGGEDIFLHINPRFDQRYIARNSKIHKKWGHEESQMLQAMPLTPGSSFFLEILISPTDFLISIDGMHLFIYSHRFHYQDIKSVEISEAVEVTQFLISHPSVYPSKPLVPLQLPLTEEHHCPVFSQLDNLQTGDVIEIIARIDSLPHMMYINLQAGFQQIPHPIISYHITARYSPSWVVVQNSWSSGKWNEEVSEKLPGVLLPGETVHIHIRCQPNGYSTLISGKQLKLLPYRVPLGTCNSLVAQGDMKIISIKTSANLKTLSECS